MRLTKKDPIGLAKAFRSDVFDGKLFYRDDLGWVRSTIHEHYPELRHSRDAEAIGRAVDTLADSECLRDVPRSEVRAMLWTWLDENLQGASPRVAHECPTVGIVNAVLDALEGVCYMTKGVF